MVERCIRYRGWSSPWSRDSCCRGCCSQDACRRGGIRISPTGWLSIKFWPSTSYDVTYGALAGIWLSALASPARWWRKTGSAATHFDSFVRVSRFSYEHNTLREHERRS
jgi:hypothetical protein